jgi:plasmid stabilization system protein ParE
VSLAIRVQPDAEIDLHDAWRWYESRTRGLGDDFLRAADACFDRIERTPEAFPVVHRQTRQALLRRFPYRVLFRIAPDRIDVIPVYHGRRDPRSWLERSEPDS